LPAGFSMAQFALKWILMFESVTCAIPGARRPDQATDNFGASEKPDLDPVVMKTIESIYSEKLAPYVHQRW